MAGFLMKQMVGNQLNEVTGSLGMGKGDDEEKTAEGEDPEVVAARLEEAERRKEKHRKMEAEREKMRQGIRDKYKIQKKEEVGAAMDFTEGRIGAPRKTPEQIAAEMNAEDDSIIGQLGLTEQVERAKTLATGAFETVKGFLPFDSGVTVMTGESGKTPPVKADATTAQVDEKAKFAVPDWATRPPAGSHLDVCKGDQLIQKLMIDEKPAYYFGRNPKQVDFAVEHASCSRVHALLMYHGVLKRFALVDMESSHGTFLGNVRLEPLKVVFVDIGIPFHFGASTRRYTLRLRIVQSKENEDEEKEKMPSEQELENVTEYNTALNRRIPQLPISAEEARRKKRPRGNVAFIEQEEIINPEDVDPSIGRFRNLVATAIISNNPNKRTAPTSKGQEPPRKIVRPFRDVSLASPMCSTLGGMSLNAAPDLELYSKTLPEPGQHNLHPHIIPMDSDEPHKKKYAKESWPGRKPSSGVL